jgi:Flp pilus assembly protein TadG
MRRCSRLRNDNRGQALIEFAVTLPILLLLILGLFDLGRAVYTYNTLSNISREGARMGMVMQGSQWTVDGNHPGVYTAIVPYSTTNTIVGRVVKQSVALQPDLVTVTISTPLGTGRFMKLPVTVQLDYTFTPMFSEIIGGGTTINLRAQSTMRIE